MTPKHLAPIITTLITAALTLSCGEGASTETAPAPAPSSAPSTVTTHDVRPFRAYTHCGLESARIDGRWWHAKTPLYNKSQTGPPGGWGDPYQKGTLTRESPDRAVFEALGQKVVFVPAPDDGPVRICL